MARNPIPTWFFAVVVVRRGNQFLLVHERKHGQRWYLPAGRVEIGESFAEAARRESLEETGIPVRLVGILRVEHTPKDTSARMRVVFLAEPADDSPPKSVPDAESLGAKWVTVDQISDLCLRGSEVQEMCSYVESGGPVYPLAILQQEGCSY